MYRLTRPSWVYLDMSSSSTASASENIIILITGIFRIHYLKNCWNLKKILVTSEKKLEMRSKMVRIYNTITRKKEAFQPLEAGKVSMYVCGPTVYNYIHIGNARPAIVFDMVRRYFEYKGYEVNYVLNFTDVDDKIINAPNELGEEVAAVANRFIDAYLADVQALGVQEATHNPRVTESMDDIIDFIASLIEKDFAYAADGDVYFKPRA